MKFAFSTADSQQSLAAIAASAKTFGFDGVELQIPAAVPTSLQRGDVEVACISGGSAHDAQHIRSLIELAGTITCGLVKITESLIPPGRNRVSSGLGLGDWLSPLADYAADRGVCLVLDNTQSLRSARETWAILDRLNHPSVGCCLDVPTAVLIGESPQVAVPMLNSRIAYVQVGDASQFGAMRSSIKTTITRLRGIGYGGWLSVRSTTSPEMSGEALSNALQTLGGWIKTVARTKSKVKAAGR